MTDDWLDAIAAMLDAEVLFLTVGAHAMAVHGVPRGTQDLDLWVEPGAANARRVWQALAAFGAPLESLGVHLDDFQKADTVVQVGLPPNRIDILTSISGVPDFAAGRLKDLADVEALERKPPRST